MLIIPVKALASQQVETVVGSQVTTLNIYQKQYGLFMDVLLNNGVIIQGVLCLNGHLIIRNTYLGYIGDFMWIDTQGFTDPTYTGLGSQYVLAYMEPADLTGLPNNVS